MSLILAQVQGFLQEALEGKAKIDPALIDEFAANVKAAVTRRFSEPNKNEFTLRASNVGRPTCQLQMEASGVKGEPAVYSDIMRNTFGDLIEQLAILVMKAAKVDIRSVQGPVTLNIGDINLKGTYDIDVAGKIYDIKSCSKYAFNHKFGPRGGFMAIKNSDDFGYVAQGYLYAEAEKKQFGGWIAINKETGEWAVTEAPDDAGPYKSEALEKADKAIRTIREKKPFQRCFDDEQELFRGKPTGNTVLGATCSFCPYKTTCWPGVQLRPQAQSKAMSPRLVWYTKYVEIDKMAEGDLGGKDSTEPQGEGPQTTAASS
jgi:hypothetical protein